MIRTVDQHIAQSARGMIHMPVNALIGAQRPAILISASGVVHLVGDHNPDHCVNFHVIRLPLNVMPSAVGRILMTYREKVKTIVTYHGTQKDDYGYWLMKRDLRELRNIMEDYLTPEMLAVIVPGKAIEQLSQNTQTLIKAADHIGNALAIGLEALRYCKPFVSLDDRYHVIITPDDAIKTIVGIWQAERFDDPQHLEQVATIYTKGVSA